MIGRSLLAGVIATLALPFAGCDDMRCYPAEAYGTERTTAPAPALEATARDSRDCGEVARFYADAIAVRDFGAAAKVWREEAMNESALAELFSAYRAPHIEWDKPSVEGAAGSLYCTIPGVLGDAADSDRPLARGKFTLRRVNDVPGASIKQLRWNIVESTLVESMEREAT